MGSFKVSGFLLGIELGFQIGKIILDVFKEVKKEMSERDKPTVCFDCPLAKAMEGMNDPPAKTRKLKAVK